MFSWISKPFKVVHEVVGVPQLIGQQLNPSQWLNVKSAFPLYVITVIDNDHRDVIVEELDSIAKSRRSALNFYAHLHKRIPHYHFTIIYS